MHRQNEVWKDLALGAAAGAVATWAMGLATTYLYEHEDAQARQREDAARGGKTAYGSAADKAAGLVGVELSEEARQRAGSALHWTLGAGAGAAYGLLRRRWPRVTAGQGLAFGTAFFALMDEGANTALALTPPPQAFPWQAHARGFAAHLLYGAVTETVLDVADRVRA